MLTPSEVGSKYRELEKEVEDGWENLLKEFTPDHPHSPFHRFPGQIISNSEKTQLQNIWLARVHRLEQTIQKMWREYDAWRGVGSPNRKAQAKQFIETRLEQARPWFEMLVTKHNAEALKTSASTAQATSLPLSTTEQAARAPSGRIRKKRSTARGDGRWKLIAALTKHHQYADGSCLNLEPIGNNELAKVAGVSPSTASVFFKAEFGEHDKYTVACRNKDRLLAALKLLNYEFRPLHLLGDAASKVRASEKEDADKE